MAVVRDFSLDSGGLSIRGKLALPSFASTWPVVVLCHGIPSGEVSPDEPGYDSLASRITEEGAAACWFNFRGTGESEGNFSLPGWIEDLDAVLKALQSSHGPFKYCNAVRAALMGFSGGGAVSIICAGKGPRLRALVSLSSPSDFTRLINREGLVAFIKHARDIGIIRDPGFPASVEEYYEEMLDCRPLDYIEKVSPTPLLIIHGDQDEVVPAEEAGRLYEAARDPKELFTVAGGGHRLRFDESAMQKALSWIMKRLQG
ncbi:MAG: hypothetical protein A2W01_00825 [Candidatus Solincola sediminis]|uniref:Peptidase S9 prolyl oligopeptidase catalytic domain-containing protein n=1 Tax=Candidatus Solincola sediminis TaxID=1797199 RepID=A0A1F2WR62_9ACTN|nr:MAG: hypothetical protein A2Y75_10805 [Candidatus Solincola sediminis]OFW61128.1 MAG: hypothetical protein A2W01_00825 [Candidatus Solincola sediminis]